VTIEIQQRALRDWAVRDPLVAEMTGEYWDEGVSGKIPIWERPAGRRLLEDVSSGRVQCVAVAYADRFGRTLLDALQAVKMLEGKGVKLVAVNDGWDSRRQDSPLYMQFRIMIAEEEHRRIVERIESGRRRAMDRDNAPPGGPLLFGYRIGARGEFLIDPIEGPVVMRLFKMADEGCSQAEMLRWAEKTGARAGRKCQYRTGGEPWLVASHEQARWHLPKIRRILTCRTYLGERRYGSRTFPCPPLVDAETFERVQVRLGQKYAGGGWTRNDPGKGFLSGLIRCGLCGSKFYARKSTFTKPNGKKRYIFYCCAKARSGRCHAKFIQTKDLDEGVRRSMYEMLEEPIEMLEGAALLDLKSAEQARGLDQDERSVLAELESIDGEAKRLWAELDAERWSFEIIKPRLDKLQARRVAALATLDDVRKRRAQNELRHTEVRQAVSHLAQYRAMLKKKPTPADLRNLARALLTCIVVHTIGKGQHKTAKVELVWKSYDAQLPPECRTTRG
jgi:site-specific DNA recombinase